MSTRAVGAVPGLFLTFLAPSFRQPLPRLNSSRQPLSTAAASSSTGKGEHDVKGRRKRVKDVGDTREWEQKRMSGLATQESTRDRWSEHASGPVASTSAVRLDSLVCPQHHPLPPITQHEQTPLLPFSVDERTGAVSDLPNILSTLKTLTAKSPSDSPSSIIRTARTKAYDDSQWTRKAPIPPPPIVLHPQPYSDSTFFTPFLLQAIVLSASALGLFARRKVRTTEAVAAERNANANKSARERAEDRIDEVQALNLLIAAHAVPEASSIQDAEGTARWREEALRPLVELITNALESDVPLNRLGVASILHFVHLPISSTKETTQSPRHDETRAVLLTQALEAYRQLPPPSSSSPDFPLDSFVSSSLIKIASMTCRSEGNLSEDAFDLVSTRMFSSPSSYSDESFAQLGRCAAQCKDLDVLSTLLATDRLSPSLRLELAVTALDIAASRRHWRSERETIVPLAQHFASAVEQVGEMDKEGMRKLDRGIYLLCTAYSIDRPLEPYMTRAIRAALSRSSSQLEQFRPRLVRDVLRHLSDARNPTLLRQVFEAVPSVDRRLSHFHPLLSSSHPKTSQYAWDLLLSHPTINLTEAGISARFTSHARQTSLSSTFDLARRDFQLARRRGIAPSIDVWNKMLQVTIRFGNDGAVEGVLRGMERAGIERNQATREILIQREMVRQDTQVRLAKTKRAGRLEGAMGSADEERIVVPRRSGGKAQMRKVREAIRRGPTFESNGESIDITSNLLLKNFTRWSVECDNPRLLQLVKVFVGIELVDHLATPTRWPTSSPSTSLVDTQPPLPIETPPSVLALSKEAYMKVRVPAFRTLVSAFERRGRFDLAKDLRQRMRTEREEFEKRSRR